VDRAPALAPADVRGTERRLQLKVLVASCGLLLAVVAATWAYVQASAGRAVDAALARDLELDRGLVGRVQTGRFERLQLTARLVASFPNLKALFDSTDAATVSDYLLSYQQQNPGTPLLVALGPSGNVLGRTDTSDIGGTPDDKDWVIAVTGNPGEPAVVLVGGRPYHAAIAPAAAGGTVFGYVVTAAPVDEAFARAIGEATGDDAVLLSDVAVLGSTLTTGQPSWTSLADWRRHGGSADRANAITIGTRRYAAREVPLAQQPPVSAVIARSRDDALEPFRRIQRGLVLIGLAGIVAALAASLWLYRTVIRPGRPIPS
jgi:Double sensory domain of two-component sensor kinase